MTSIEQLELSDHMKEVLGTDWESRFADHRRKVIECITGTQTPSRMIPDNIQVGVDMAADLRDARRRLGQELEDLFDECLILENTLEAALDQGTLHPNL